MRGLKHGANDFVVEVRVYKSKDCSTGPIVQPLNDWCSEIAAFGSVRVLVE